MKLSIIIPNYNGAQLLKKNVPHVYEAASFYKKQTGHSFEIIVTDDASHDNSKAIVESLPFSVLFLEHMHNEGFSTNVNRGVSKATGEILVLLNSDVAPNKEFLLPLVKHFHDASVFAVGCLEKSLEKGGEKLRGRGLGKFSQGFLMHRAGEVTKSTTLWASGGSSAFSRSVWQRLGGLYDIYSPFYWEDIDLSYRAQKAGYKVLFEPLSVVRHEHESGAIRTQFSSKKITAIAYRNQFLFVWLNITDTSYLWEHIRFLPRHFVQAVMRGDVAFLLGFIKALGRFAEVRKLRQTNKKLFKRSDQSVLSEFV